MGERGVPRRKRARKDKFEIVVPSLSILAEPPVAARYAKRFPKVKLFTIDEVFGGWQKAQKRHFADGGVYDRIYQAGK